MNHLTTLSATELLRQWKLHRFFEPPRLDCTIRRIDTLDTDTLLAKQIHRWYLDLLDTLPPHQLPQTEVSSRLTLTPTPSGAGLVSLPDDIYRITSITLGSWLQPATIVAPDTPLARAQTSPYARARTCRPVAVTYGRLLYLHTPDPAGDTIARATALLYPTDQAYPFTPHMLSLITNPQLS